jgi:hypothetical protein
VFALFVQAIVENLKAHRVVSKHKNELGTEVSHLSRCRINCRSSLFLLIGVCGISSAAAVGFAVSLSFSFDPHSCSLFAQITVSQLSHKPFLGEDDTDKVFFASVHGYGKSLSLFGPCSPVSSRLLSPFPFGLSRLRLSSIRSLH